MHLARRPFVLSLSLSLYFSCRTLSLQENWFSGCRCLFVLLIPAYKCQCRVIDSEEWVQEFDLESVLARNGGGDRVRTVGRFKRTLLHLVHLPVYPEWRVECVHSHRTRRQWTSVSAKETRAHLESPLDSLSLSSLSSPSFLLLLLIFSSSSSSSSSASSSSAQRVSLISRTITSSALALPSICLCFVYSAKKNFANVRLASLICNLFSCKSQQSSHWAERESLLLLSSQVPYCTCLVHL